jgi:hypothetical protein
MPSERLLNLLQAEGLASRADLKASEPMVRQLSGDLPDFDFVWLDALVQRRHLTPWQAEQLQAEPPGKLNLGPCILQQPLGQHTYLARTTASNTSVVARKLLPAPGTTGDSIRQRAHDILSVVQKSSSAVPKSLILPQQVLCEESQNVWLISDYVTGWGLDELLTRGGRLPWPAVAEIGREIMDMLAWFESVHLQHGNLTSSNVRLCSHGRIAIVDALSRRISRPMATVGLQVSLRECDGMAPELIGTGRLPDARSELYAAGCLLWHLLTSRPVVLSADPIRRLMKQREHDIEDVRNFVPDCPEWMARSLQAMTRRLPELRPAGVSEIQQLWQPFCGTGFKHLRRIAHAMPDRASRTIQAGRVAGSARRTWSLRSAGWTTVAATVLAGGVFLSTQSEFSWQPMPLNFRPWSELLTSQRVPEAALAENPESTPKAALVVETLPEPDAEGTIQLQGGKTYLAGPRRSPGPLRIVSAGKGTASIQIPRGTQWILQARSVELRGLSIGLSDEPSPTTKNAPQRITQMVAVQCGALAVDGCVLQSPSDADDFSGLGWYRPSGAEGIVLITNTVFAGGGYGLSLNHPPQRFELRNVLLANRGSGMLCEFSNGDSDAWSASLKNVTQRFGFSLADVIVHEQGPQALNLTMTSQDCVYQPRMAVVRIRPVNEWKPDAMLVRFSAGDTGQPAIVSPSADSVVYINRTLGQPVSLPESRLPDNMLLFAEVTFDETEPQTSSSPWSASALADFDGPKLSTQLPGIVVSELPGGTE